jgi:hypothetical protein
VTEIPRPTASAENDLRAKLNHSGPVRFTRDEIRALIAEVDRLRSSLLVVRNTALAGAVHRVAALPTANDGQLIAAFRDVILNTITSAEA